MKVAWKREILTWAQYFLLVFIAALASTVVEYYDIANDPITSDIIGYFDYATFLKNVGPLYGWMFLSFLVLSCVRFSLLFIFSQAKRELP